MPEENQRDITGLIKVEITEDKMQAYITLPKPEGDKPEPITANELYFELNEAGVEYGILDDVINDLVIGKLRGERVLIAKGHDPVDGEDARFEFYFPTEKSSKPKVAEDGKIDYKEINLISSVQKDALLVKKIAATSGTNGVDVRGTVTLSMNGKDTILSLGPGVYKDIETGLLARAGVNGVVYYNPRNNYLEVQQLYVVQSNVDYSTGNVHVNCSVEIKGDVKPGFTISSSGNIDIKGVVEVARINCDGTLNVKDGIIGDGTIVVNAGSDLHTGYLNKAFVKCNGSVYVASEIRKSVVECNEELMIMKPFGVILGGKVTAANKIVSPFIGNSYNVPTEIEVGIIPKYRDKYLAKQKERTALKKQQEEYTLKVTQLSQSSTGGTIDPRLKAALKLLDECNVKLEKATTELGEIEQAYLSVPDPGVYAARTVFPGVTIRIKHLVFEVKEVLNHVMFKIIGEEIACLPFRQS